MAFSTMLKQLREEKHLSQKDIAEYLGVTRQAIASYELAKREPDYDVLKKLADYFGVSIDYLLGRAKCRDVNAFTIGRNIALIRGSMPYREFSEAISRKTGAMIFSDMLEYYENGERMPFVGTIKILAKYAEVHDSFFYTHNTMELYQKERELYQKEMAQTEMSLRERGLSPRLSHFDVELKQWIENESNTKYVKLAKKIQEAGITVESLMPLIENIALKK